MLYTLRIKSALKGEICFSQEEILLVSRGKVGRQILLVK